MLNETCLTIACEFQSQQIENKSIKCIQKLIKTFEEM